MRSFSFFRPWGRFYARWAFAQSFASVAIAALLVAGLDRFTTTSVLVFSYAISLSFIVLSGRNPIRLCNAVTAARWLLALLGLGWILLLDILSMPLEGGPQWGLLILFGLAEATDAIDGYLARRRGPTSYGAKLDMETDSAFGFVLSFVAVAFLGMPEWVLALGLFHYVYFLVFRFVGDPGRVAPGYKGFAKAVCAVLMVGLIATVAPFLTHHVKTTINAISLVLLTISFAWDFYLRVLPLQTARS